MLLPVPSSCRVASIPYFKETGKPSHLNTGATESRQFPGFLLPAIIERRLEPVDWSKQFIRSLYSLQLVFRQVGRDAHLLTVLPA